MAGSDLPDELRRHMADSFPESVAKGEAYGEVDAVMIDADICGWAEQSGFLDALDRQRLRKAADELERSIQAFPADARPYYQRLLRVARLALVVS